MKATLGWVVLSKEALKRAEAQLQEDIQGVLDEVGFLTLHQAYANLLFPGTSVLQTRLRYILFVPWLYNDIASIPGTKNVYQEIQRKEIELASRLRHLGLDQGVIGGRSYPKPTSQPASMVYWTALREWGFLRQTLDGNYPSHTQAHRYIESLRTQRRILDDDKQPLYVPEPLFITLPQPPKEWSNPREKLDFTLTHDEAKFTYQQLLGVFTRDPDGVPHPSMISILIGKKMPVSQIDRPWAPEILNIVGDRERDVLVRARKVAALSAIGRGVYAALVEHLRDYQDHLPTENIHRENLQNVLETYKEDALNLEISEITQDAPQLMGSSILDILSGTQLWLRKENELPYLLDLFREVEIQRKGRRARLSSSLAGKERRAEWFPKYHSKAYPLSYRWSNVQRLFSDLIDVI